MSAFDVRDLLEAARQPGAGSQALGEGFVSAETSSPIPAGSLLSPVVLAGIVRIAEFALIVALGIACHQIELRGVVPLRLSYLGAIVVIAAIALALFQAAGTYRIAAFRAFAKTAMKLIGGWTLAFLCVAGMMVLAKISDHYSRLWLTTYYAAGLGLLLTGRVGLNLFIASRMRRGLLDRRTAIVGGGPAAEEMIRALEASGDGSIRIVGVFDDRNDDRSTDHVAGYPKLGTVNDLVAYARRARLDLIVFTLPIAAESRILQMLAKLWVLPIELQNSKSLAVNFS